MTPIAASGSKLRPDTRAMRSSASWRETQERYKTAQARSGEAHASSLPSVSPPRANAGTEERAHLPDQTGALRPLRWNRASICSRARSLIFAGTRASRA